MGAGQGQVYVLKSHSGRVEAGKRHTGCWSWSAGVKEET